MLQTFDIVNCADNQESQLKLFQLIEKGEGILFTGSGTSRRLGYPSWEEALSDLSNLIPTDSDKLLAKSKIQSEELLLAAELIKNKIDHTHYNSMFEKHFGPKAPPYDSFHKLLVTLNFKAFVTTNYDPTLAKALESIQAPGRDYGIVISSQSKSQVHAFLNHMVDASDNERYELFLHGRYDLPTSTILSYGDYVEKYDGLNLKDQVELYNKLLEGNIDIPTFESKSYLKSRAFRTLHYKVIYLLFATQKMVFVGFGLRDPFLNKIINDFQEDFNPLKPSHFVLQSKNGTEPWNKFYFQDVKRKWRNKGIELVFFEDNKSFEGIERFFEHLSPASLFGTDFTIVNNTLKRKKEEATDQSKNQSKIEDENINHRLIEKAKKEAKALKQK